MRIVKAIFKTMFLFPPDLSFGAPVDDELPIATHAFMNPVSQDALRIARPFTPSFFTGLKPYAYVFPRMTHAA